MKGAIGNAFILNMVITFIVIFYMLLIGSMAYSKAYKVKNYLLNSIVNYDEASRNKIKNSNRMTNDNLKLIINGYVATGGFFDEEVDETLSKYGYSLSYQDKSCPEKTGYSVLKNTLVGHYDYCIYWNFDENFSNIDNDMIYNKYNYMVLVYMKFDFPVIGNFIKVPLTGETKTITVFN